MAIKKDKPQWEKEGDFKKSEFKSQFAPLIERIRKAFQSFPKKIKEKYGEEEILEIVKQAYLTDKQEFKVNKGETLSDESKEKLKIVNFFEKKLNAEDGEVSGLILSGIDFVQKEKDNSKSIKDARKNLKMSNVEMDYKTGKTQLSKEKEDIKDIGYDALHEDRVYSELLIKIVAPKELANNLKKLWDKYIKESDPKTKQDSYRMFIDEYNKYTNVLEKVLGKFYEKDVKLNGPLEEEIYDNLKYISKNKKTLQQLVAEYKKRQPDKFYDEKTEKMSEDLENTYILNDIFMKAFKYIEMKNRSKEAYLKDKDFNVDSYQLKEFEQKTKPTTKPKDPEKPPKQPKQPEKPREPEQPETPPQKPEEEGKKPEEQPDQTPPQITVEGKIRIKTAFISYSEKLAKDYARDMADRKMSEGYKETKPMGFFAKLGNGIKRIWKYGMFREYYRQKEVAKFNKGIIDKGNLFVDEDLTSNSQSNLNGAIIERLISIDDLSEATHQGEKARYLEDPVTKGKVIEIIKSYALGIIGDTEFIDLQKRLSEELKNKNPDIFEDTVIDANNLLETAKGLKIAFEHDKGLKNVDIDLDIIIGNMKAGVRTEQKLSGVDRLVDKMQKTKVGKFVNETTLASALSIFQGIGNSIGSLFLYNKVAAVASLGGTALLSGILGGVRKRNYWDDKRIQHTRDVASGREIDKKDKQRLILERYRVDTLSAPETIKKFDEVLKALKENETKDTIPLDKASEYIGLLALVEARINLSDDRLIDLVAYSSPNMVDKERTQLDIKRSSLKKDLRKLAGKKGWTFGGTTFDEYYKMHLEANQNKILEDDNGVNQKNKEFSRFKLKEGGKAFVRSAVTGLVIGVAAQEIIAAVNPNQQGAIESWFGRIDENATSKTLLKEFTDYVGDRFSGGTFAGHTEVIDFNSRNRIVPIGEGRELKLGQDGNYDLYNNGKLVSEDIISFEKNGNIIDNTKVWNEHRIFIDDASINTISPEASKVLVSSNDIAKSNPDMVDVAGKRDWIRNETRGIYDLNESRLNLDVSKSGDPVIDVSSMTSKGSFDVGKEVDLIQAIKDGNAKILVSMSKESSGRVFELPLTAKQLTIADNSVVSPLFDVVGNKPVFNGGTIEVAVKNGDIWQILSTHEGSNIINNLSVNTRVPEIVRQMSIKVVPEAAKDLPYIFPPFIPILPDKPLTGVKKVTSGSVNAIPIRIEIDTRAETKKEMSGREAGYELAKMAKTEGIEISKLSREDYVTYAKMKAMPITDSEIRASSDLREATTKEEFVKIQESKIREINKDSRDSMNNFKEEISKKFKANDKIFKKDISIVNATKDWLYFDINGGNKETGNISNKSYFSFKNLASFDPKDFVEFAEFLREKGAQIQIKIVNSLEKGVMLNDQVVMYGKESEKALNLAEEFFGDKIKKQGLGKDIKEGDKWVTYSELLAREIKDSI